MEDAAAEEEKEEEEDEEEMQMEEPSALSLTLKRKGNFVWKEMGFTECSESCLGGEFLSENIVI